MYGCTVWLNHNDIGTFYEKAWNPDVEELERRDGFIEQIKEEGFFRTEGTDLIAEIPDININALMNLKSATDKPKVYIAGRLPKCFISLGTSENSREQHSAYVVRSTLGAVA